MYSILSGAGLGSVILSRFKYRDRATIIGDILGTIYHDPQGKGDSPDQGIDGQKRPYYHPPVIPRSSSRGFNAVSTQAGLTIYLVDPALAPV